MTEKCVMFMNFQYHLNTLKCYVYLITIVEFIASAQFVLDYHEEQMMMTCILKNLCTEYCYFVAFTVGHDRPAVPVLDG